MKLNLGCGNRKLPGYTNVDLNSEYADIKADIRYLSMFDDDSADEIIASHVIEHFFVWEVKTILEEWKRVLKPGGHIYVECPNLRSCCAMLLHGDFEDKVTMWGIYGDPHHMDPLWMHKWGYTPETLAWYLKKAGFVDIGKSEVKKIHWRDMRLVATKPGGTDGV